MSVSCRPFAHRFAAFGWAVAVGSALLAPLNSEARGPREGGAAAGLPSVGIEQLPPEAQHTNRLIQQGGPFPYAKDGVVFGNRERLLPRESRGYYHEYTVPTPGAGNRGARRIVCGGLPPNRPQACYYTDNHYQSFRRITP